MIDPATGAALISGGLGLLGGIMSNNSASAEAANNREWQKMMSDTAHQREVKDLELAGLNPILSATGGSGASTPSGAMAVPKPVTSAQDVAQAMKLEKEKDLLDAQNWATTWQGDKYRQDVKEGKARTDLIKAQERLTDTQNTAMGGVSAKSRNEEAVYNSLYGKYVLAPIETTMRAASPFVQSAHQINSMLNSSNSSQLDSVVHQYDNKGNLKGSKTTSTSTSKGRRK